MPILYNYNGIKYSILDHNKKTAQTGFDENNHAAETTFSTSFLKIPSQIYIQNTFYYVTEIAECSFADCINIKSIFIPATVEKIRFKAFYRLRECTSVTFEEHSKLSYIGDHAFYDFYHLVNISFTGNCLTTIEERAFLYSKFNLSKIIFPPSLKELGSMSFAGIPTLLDVYYCGENEIKGSNIFTIGNPNLPETSQDLKIHVTTKYPSQKFGERDVTDYDAANFCIPLSKNCKIRNSCVVCNPNQNHFILFVLIVIYYHI